VSWSAPTSLALLLAVDASGTLPITVAGWVIAFTVTVIFFQDNMK
jgi:hypothetical protein